LKKAVEKMEDYDSKRQVQKIGRESIIGVERGVALYTSWSG
jgi:hypothetical protein